MTFSGVKCPTQYNMFLLLKLMLICNHRVAIRAGPGTHFTGTGRVRVQCYRYSVGHYLYCGLPAPLYGYNGVSSG